MSNIVFGFDMGSNSIGWAIAREEAGKPTGIVGVGTRIFTKAVKEKTPTPKNKDRREARGSRRLLQRRAARKKQMLGYLIELGLLPTDIKGTSQPERILNMIGNPYYLRAKALDEQLTRYELGRVLLHLEARRGFLSNKKLASGDLIDDPDMVEFKEQLDAAEPETDESIYLEQIKGLNQAISKSGLRTLGEYLYHREKHDCQRNRSINGGELRTDRAMYKHELECIWSKQQPFFTDLPSDFMAENKGVKKIIFYQRPLKKPGSAIGNCSLEKKHKKTLKMRLEFQRFRYLLNINNLKRLSVETGQYEPLTQGDRLTLQHYFETHLKVTYAGIKKQLGIKRNNQTELTPATKSYEGNVTASKIRNVITEQWDRYSPQEQIDLVEDLLTLKKKSALKRRLINQWGLENKAAIRLCLLEFEPGHGSHSLKVVRRLLPDLKDGYMYAQARVRAGYGYEREHNITINKLARPEKTNNPIVDRALNEFKRVVNALIRVYGKPDIIRIEMARDLEMNTKKYEAFIKQQKQNEKNNEVAKQAYQRQGLGEYPPRSALIRHGLWVDQKGLCAYSGEQIDISRLFTGDVEVDHILPKAYSLDDSYMNKVLCFQSENTYKGNRTPIDAWGGDAPKWAKIEKAIKQWRRVESKVSRFYVTQEQMMDRDFISSQLNDTRYISKKAREYVVPLVGGDNVFVTKGAVVAKMRAQWGLNNLLGESNQKERSDHRHHAIDAAIIATTTQSLYIKAISQMKSDELLVPAPFPSFKSELEQQLEHLIVSHTPQRKLSGALHEKTGAMYKECHGGLVYRKALDNQFTHKQAKKIVDRVVKSIVLKQLGIHANNSRKAFSSDQVVLHKDGVTPIKRVRILQSEKTLKFVESRKLAVKNKEGRVFKYLTYGSVHHAEVLCHKKTGKFRAVMVNMMQASHRLKGIKSELNKQGVKGPSVQTEHGEEWSYVEAMYKNDLVSLISEQGERVYYRVEKFDAEGSVTLRLNIAATIKDDKEKVSGRIETLKNKGLKLHKINAIGVVLEKRA